MRYVSAFEVLGVEEIWKVGEEREGGSEIDLYNECHCMTGNCYRNRESPVWIPTSKSYFVQFGTTCYICIHLLTHS